jgi:ribosomal protein S18 acetylase RimI-like enzyme
MTGRFHNWTVRRWDGWHYYNDDETMRSHTSIHTRTHVWENGAGELVAAVHPEGAGEAYFEIHPAYRHLEAEMLDWAERHLAVTLEDGRKRLRHQVYEFDDLRHRLLQERGYHRLEWDGFTRYRLVQLPIAEAPIAAGYSIRTIRRDPADWQQMANLLNAAFRRDFHHADEYRNFQRAPCYDEQLDLAAIAPDGTIVATVGVSCDDDYSYAEFEPVCTHPDHQRRGLARALMAEGLHRLQRRGVPAAIVSAGSNSTANDLYLAMGFTFADQHTSWEKSW